MCAHGKVPGWPMCHCAACHRDFTGPSAFTEHQTTGGPGGVVCRPGGRLAVLATAEGRELWGYPKHKPPEAYARAAAEARP
jgi:hypothetical protein